LSAVELVTRLTDAARSANNFDCVGFIAAYDSLSVLLEGGSIGDERSILMPLFASSGAPLAALYDFCNAPQNRDDSSSQLPSGLANDAFRDARALLRNALRALNG
jgi:hypothetical protein